MYRPLGFGSQFTLPHTSEHQTQACALREPALSSVVLTHPVIHGPRASHDLVFSSMHTLSTLDAIPHRQALWEGHLVLRTLSREVPLSNRAERICHTALCALPSSRNPPSLQFLRAWALLLFPFSPLMLGTSVDQQAAIRTRNVLRDH